MTESARKILDAVRRALGGGSEPAAADAAHAGLFDGAAPRPVWSEDRVERFAAQLQRVAGSCARVPDLAAVPAAVARFLQAEDVAPELVLAPHPLARAVPWPERWRVSTQPIRSAACAVGVAVAECGIAETGSLVFPSGPQHPTLLNLLPDDLLVLLPRADLVDHMEDVWPRLQAKGPLPRTVNFITGPSRTADVEQTIQIGAHGARRLHVLLIG